MSVSEDPYEQLAALAERERALAEAGVDGGLEGIAALERIAAERTALVARLPERPPAHARGALERAAEHQAAAERALRHAVADTRRALADVDRSRRALRGYGAGQLGAPGLKSTA